MTEVSIATWNLHQAVDRRPANVEATWRYLTTALKPTIGLLQEATTIPKTSGGSFSNQAGQLRYNTAVVAFDGRLERLPDVSTKYSSKTTFSITPQVPGTFEVARVIDLPGVEPFVAISLYGRMAPLYAQTSMLRAIADLIPLFDATRFNKRVVLGGDLNVYDQTKDRVMRERWRAILAMVESLGLENLLKRTQPDRGAWPRCICGDPACFHAETFRHVNTPADQPGLTTDYLFATKDLADRLRALEVWGDRHPEVWKLSDHCPLVARFDL